MIKFNLQFFGWDDIGGESGSKSEFTKFEPNTPVTIRIVDEAPHSRWIHWINAQKRGVNCIGKDCPICNVIKEDKANNRPQRYSSVKKHTVNVWNYNTNRVEILEQGNEFFGTLLGYKQLQGDVRNYDLRVVRTGKDKDTKYTMLPQAITPLPLPIVEEIERGYTKLDEYFTLPTREQIIEIMSGKPVNEVLGGEKKEEATATATVSEPSEQEVSFVTE